MLERTRRADRLTMSLQGADMTQSLRCPNPICSHIFGESEIGGASSLSCPVCGMIVQIRTPEAQAAIPHDAPTVSAKPVRVPMAQPVRPIPMAQRVAPNPPMAQPVSQPTQPTPVPPTVPDELQTPIVRARYSRSRDWLTYPVAFGVFFLLCALTVVGYFVSQRTSRGGGSHDGGYKHSDYNFSFDPKSTKWQENPELKSKIGVSQLALQRSAPNGYFAVDVIDFRDH